jgi:hypothetical protein
MILGRVRPMNLPRHPQFLKRKAQQLALVLRERGVLVC